MASYCLQMEFKFLNCNICKVFIRQVLNTVCFICNKIDKCIWQIIGLKFSLPVPATWWMYFHSAIRVQLYLMSFSLLIYICILKLTNCIFYGCIKFKQLSLKYYVKFISKEKKWFTQHFSCFTCFENLKFHT